MVRSINKFGEAGGFDIILERIENKQNPMALDVLQHIMKAFGNVHSLFIHDFAVDYFPSLLNAVEKNLMCSSDLNIRNLSKEKIEAVLEALDLLLKRVYSLNQKY